MTANVILSGGVVSYPELKGILKGIAEALEIRATELKRREHLEAKLMRWWYLPEGIAHWLAHRWPRRWLSRLGGGDVSA